MYSLIYSKEVFKQLKKLNKEMKNRVISTLERIRIRPHAHIKKLVASPYFSLRVRSYRIILDVKNNELKIFVIEIDHRKRVYKS